MFTLWFHLPVKSNCFHPVIYGGRHDCFCFQKHISSWYWLHKYCDPPPKSFYSKNLLLVQTSPSPFNNLSASSLSGDRLVKPKHASVPASSLVKKQGLLRGKPVCCWVWDGGWSQCSPRGRYESSFSLFFVWKCWITSELSRAVIVWHIYVNSVLLALIFQEQYEKPVLKQC